jgi:hypothetical protein
MLIDDLLNHIFEGKSNFLTQQVAVWVKESRRYRAFAETYKDKIRKKHRLADDDEKLYDLLLELETAYRLLGDTRFVVEYEKLNADKSRAPDYSITFRANTLFNVEVTRIRSADSDLPAKFIYAVCDKVGQLPPSVVNVLYIGGSLNAEEALSQAMTSLRLLAERKEEPFFTRRGFKDAATFLRQFQRLSAILLPGDSLTLWQNGLARHPLPNALKNALLKIGGS